MNVQATLSSKGQIVVPKAVRDELGWLPGAKIEMIVRPGGVMLRSTPERSGSTAAEALARIRARSPYHGPKITDEDMHQAVREVAAEQDLRTLP